VNVLRVVDNLFADRADFDLNRGEPQWKCSSVVLNSTCRRSVRRSRAAARWTIRRLVASAIIADVFKAEARWQIEIELHGGELPGAAEWRQLT